MATSVVHTLKYIDTLPSSLIERPYLGKEMEGESTDTCVLWLQCFTGSFVNNKNKQIINILLYKCVYIYYLSSKVDLTFKAG